MAVELAVLEFVRDGNLDVLHEREDRCLRDERVLETGLAPDAFNKFAAVRELQTIGDDGVILEIIVQEHIPTARDLGTIESKECRL